MNSKEFKSYFVYTKEQRLGIVVLLSIIICLQLLFYFVDFSSDEKLNDKKEKWLSLQKVIDSTVHLPKDITPKIYPFNPNFITDFKGYKLGMSVTEIDKLHAYRKLNKYVNSPAEFQHITGVSDSLLNTISPYFKFPDWVTNKKSYPKSTWIDYSKITSEKKISVTKTDINQATKEDLMKIYGIGDAISDRILKQKASYGEFVSMKQMEDVWGLSPEVIEKLHTSFGILETPKPKKININNASIKELGVFPYFRYPISKNIVTFRSMHGDIKKEDLTNIKDFPLERIEIIALYLEF
ncbi:MAG: helix-hairpin-helix domain-containing protein [Bacteroidota bacterium]